MQQRPFLSSLGVAALTILGAVSVSNRAHADLTLTPAGVAAGFTLSTFADSFPFVNNIGPLGITFSGGQVIVSDYPGNVRVFPTDTDGQHATSVAIAQNYGFSNAVGLTTVGSKTYMTQQSAASIVQINANGTFNQNIVGYANATGIISNPNNGHLFVSNGSNIIDVDPIAKTSVLFNGAPADGLATDGTTLYAAVSINSIVGYNILTKAQTFTSGFVNTADGSALGFGALSGNIFANTNDGRLVEINLLTSVQTILATGGTRGDFVTVDPNGSLLVTQTDRIVRLTARAGGGFSSTPEPGTVGLFVSVGLSSLGVLARRRRARK